MMGHLMNVIADMSENKNRQPKCDKCGCDENKVYVHGHYQCANCKCITDGDCCQGENHAQ